MNLTALSAGLEATLFLEKAATTGSSARGVRWSQADRLLGSSLRRRRVLQCLTTQAGLPRRRSACAAVRGHATSGSPPGARRATTHRRRNPSQARSLAAAGGLRKARLAVRRGLSPGTRGRRPHAGVGPESLLDLEDTGEGGPKIPARRPPPPAPWRGGSGRRPTSENRRTRRREA